MTLTAPILAFLLALPSAGPEAAKIRINSIGYRPDAPKRASIAADCGKKPFHLVRAKDGSRVFDGIVSEPIANPDTNESLCSADFSRFREPGEYMLEVSTVGRSDPFRIAENLYEKPFAVVTRGMYLWRCGTEVHGTYEGQTFHHEACHTADAWLDFVAGRHEKLASTKGWHDAGDYNKYVVNAGVTVGSMLLAWEDFGPEIREIKLDLPESGGKMPEFLAEVKWELDWLLTMQAGDGSVYQKVSTKGFGGFVLPEKETAERYFVPWGSAATADFVAMMAMASRDFRPFDPSFADRCLLAARKSDAFLKAHPENHEADQSAFTTGGYGTKDSDERIWAAAELWEATGEAIFLSDLEARIRESKARVDRDWDWGEVRNLGLLSYLFSRHPGRDRGLVESVHKNVIATADEIVKAASAHGYARPLGSSYYWGCNGAVARSAILLHAADRLSPNPSYAATILDGLNHLLGRNVDGRSYITGLGARPPLHPHDRRSGGDKVESPWPGYLVGGPHPRASSWKDDQGDYRTNEIAINWNGALIYALAAALK